MRIGLLLASGLVLAAASAAAGNSDKPSPSVPGSMPQSPMQPALATLNPSAATPGTVVTITGSNLNTFGGVPTSNVEVNVGSPQFTLRKVSIVSIEPTAVKFIVPAGLPYAEHKVYVVTRPPPAAPPSGSGDKSGFQFPLQPPKTKDDFRIAAIVKLTVLRPRNSVGAVP